MTQYSRQQSETILRHIYEAPEHSNSIVISNDIASPSNLQESEDVANFDYYKASHDKLVNQGLVSGHVCGYAWSSGKLHASNFIPISPTTAYQMLAYSRSMTMVCSSR